MRVNFVYYYFGLLRNRPVLLDFTMDVEEDHFIQEKTTCYKPQTNVLQKQKEFIPRLRSGKGSLWKADAKCFVKKCSSSTVDNPNLWFHKLPMHSNNFLRQIWLKEIGKTELEVPKLCLICQKHFTQRDFNRYRSEIKSLKRSAFPTLLLPQKPKMPVDRSKPKHVYQRSVSDATKCQIIKEEENAQENSKSNFGNDQVNCVEIKSVIETNAQANNPQEDSNIVDDQDSNDVEMKPIIENTSQKKSPQDSSNYDVIDDNLYSNDSYNNDNQNNQKKSSVVSHYAKHSHSIVPTVQNKTLKIMNDLYLKLKPELEGSSNRDSEDYKIKLFQLYHDNREAYELMQNVFDLPPVHILLKYGPSTLEKINDLYLSSLTKKVKLMPEVYTYGLVCVNLMKIQPEIVYDAEADTVSGAWLGSKSGPLQYAMITMVRGMIKDWHHIVSVKLLPSVNLCPEFSIFIEKFVIKLCAIGLNIKAVVTTTDDIFRTPTVTKSKSYFLIKYQKIHHIFNPAHLKLLLYEELSHYKYFFTQKNSVIKSIVARWEDLTQYYECDTTSKYRISDESHLINEKESMKNKLEEAAQIVSYKTAMGMSFYCNKKILDNTVMETVDFLTKINSIFAALYPKESTSIPKVLKGKDFWCSCIDYIEYIIKAYPSNTNVSINVSQPMFPEFLKISMESVAFLQSVTYLSKHESELMRCLNQDPLIEFIDKIHVNVSTKGYPTTRELINTLNQGIIQNNYHNIEQFQDNSKLDNFIENAKKLCEGNCDVKIPASKQANTDDYTQFHDRDAHSLYYISIYLLEKMYEKFKNSLSSRIKQMSSSVVYENKIRKVSGSIIVPDNDFVDFVNSMDEIFVLNYKKAIATGRLFCELINVLNKQFLTGPVDLAPLGYIKELFLKVRIYHTIKYNNKMLRTGSENYQFVACRLN